MAHVPPKYKSGSATIHPYTETTTIRKKNLATFEIKACFMFENIYYNITKRVALTHKNILTY